MKDEEGINAVDDDKRALLQPNQTREAICGWKGILAGAVCTILLLVFGVILGLMAFDKRHSSSINCLYALGGGRVIDGMFPEPRVLSTACRAELANYFNKQYLVDVDTAIAQAISYFDSLGNANRTQAVVFDIDETALSNLPQWQKYQLAGLAEDDAERLAWEEAGNAPPLTRSRDLYYLLYHKGFSVTFVTGRHEGGSNREATASNLEAAGYGTLCKHRLGTDSDPCYLQLDMRAFDDTRLASVYKPDKRAQLEAQGYSMAGSIGDQWSDLAGTSSAAASFKLPNPMYYIL